jgi:DNA-binding GntR family transcriptional regulator
LIVGRECAMAIDNDSSGGNVHSLKAAGGPAPRGARTRQAPPQRAAAVYEALKGEIVLGRAPQGSPLAELQLAERFACSQSSVREALFRLQQDGLVERDGYRGSSVSRTTAAEAQALLELRLAIEPPALALHASRASDDLAERLSHIVTSMEEVSRANDLYALTRADHDFHLSLLAAAKLKALMPILARSILLIHRFVLADPERRRTPLEAAQRHWPIIDALKSAELGRVQRELARHIGTVSEALPMLDAARSSGGAKLALNKRPAAGTMP